MMEFNSCKQNSNMFKFYCVDQVRRLWSKLCRKAAGDESCQALFGTLEPVSMAVARLDRYPVKVAFFEKQVGWHRAYDEHASLHYRDVFL